MKISLPNLTTAIPNSRLSRDTLAPIQAPASSQQQQRLQAFQVYRVDPLTECSPYKPPLCPSSSEAVHVLSPKRVSDSRYTRDFLLSTQYTLSMTQ